MSTLLLFSTTIFSCLSLFSFPVLGFAPAPSPSISHHNLTNSLHVTIKAAVNEAMDALHHIKQQQPKSSSPKERSALFDCSQFYELTITYLNQSLHPEPDSTCFDVQIWLSAALTNLDNCKTSITEQNVMIPVFLHNKASQLISNSLAINAELIKKSKGRLQELRRWLPEEDVLNLPELRRATNIIVVTKDGSGNYRTIKEALNAYRSKRIKGRVVIKIKQGTYHENLEISRDMKDVMLAGDGIGRTIITSDRCARSGFSTRQSATVSK